jgi:hypothetical protein
VPVSIYDSTKLGQRIVPDGSGGALIVWSDTRNGRDDVYIQRMDADGNALWTANGVQVTNSPLFDQGAEAVSDGAGGAIVAWSGSDRVMAQRLDPDGNRLWGDEGVLLATGTYATGTSPVSDGKGGAIISWEVGYGNHNIYAHRIRADGVILWGSGGVPVCTDGSHQKAPLSVTDDCGGAMIVWRDERAAYSTDIYAQRVDSTGTCLWAADGIAVASDSLGENLHDAVSDMAGGMIVCWHVGTGSASSRDVYAQRIDGAGARLWNADGIEVCADMMGQERPRLATDGAGGAIIAWYDYRDCPYNVYADVYAQKLSVDGVPQWTGGGVPVCTEEHTQVTVEIASNGTGGAALVWMDCRFPERGSYCVFGDIIDGDGNCLYGGNGFPVCIADAMQQSPVVASDGCGGGIFAWNDKRGLGLDIYAQRLNLYFDPPTGEEPPAAARCSLAQNYPNPFNPITNIGFGIKESGHISIRIYDAAGRLVTTLVDESRPAGRYTTEWNGQNTDGSSAASGIYFYRLVADEFVQTKKMVLRR